MILHKISTWTIFWQSKWNRFWHTPFQSHVNKIILFSLTTHNLILIHVIDSVGAQEFVCRLLPSSKLCNYQWKKAFKELIYIFKYIWITKYWVCDAIIEATNMNCIFNYYFFAIDNFNNENIKKFDSIIISSWISYVVNSFL